MKIQEIFDSVEFPGISYDEELLFDPQRVQNFKKKAALRDENKEGILLSRTSRSCARHSVRKFDGEQKVAFSDFSEILEAMALLEETDNFHDEYQYAYPSAGGLYPIDLYIYVKGNRIEGISKGLYFYNKVGHQLVKISGNEINWKAHFFNNREIYKSSAFSLFFFYDPAYSFPKYGGMGLYYGILDCGILLDLLEKKISEKGLGNCIIGELDYGKIGPNFPEKLVYLCCMEVGYPEEDSREEG